MLSHAEPKTVFKLFQDDPYYASKTSIPIESRLQFLFLEVAHRLHVPSITSSLVGNCTSSCRHTCTMIQDYKDTLPPDLITQLKRVLKHYNPIECLGYVTVEQRIQDRVYGSYVSVAINVPKVDSTLNKEERNKHVAVLPC